MPDQIREIVDSLPNVKDLRKVWKVVDGRMAAGDASFIGDLGVALAARFGEGDRADAVWQYRGVYEHLLRLLALEAGPENLTQVLRLVSADPSAPQRKRERYVASLLAAGQRPEDIAALAFGGGGSTAGATDELRACLVHELVLRDVAVRELPRVAQWTALPHWHHHPLAWLPLNLAEFEQSGDLPSSLVRGGSGGLSAPESTEVTTDEASASISAAVQNWNEASNGQYEARVFEFTKPVEPVAVPAALLASGLECLAERQRNDGFSVSACRPATAWRMLFAAASTGGAYNHGCYGAYGRLYAWRSLAGLAGLTGPAGLGDAADGASAAEVVERVSQCSWYEFDADSPWFYQVAWDVGLAAVDPDRLRLAVLASTDTD